MLDSKSHGSLADSVASDLQSAIIDGSLDLGSALSEDSIAEAFGVSRTPVRQALQLLQTRGLVTIRPKAGTFVFEPTVEQITELSEFRMTLEVQAARWSFERDRKASADGLRTVVQSMSDAIAAHDMSAYGRADTAYHEVFFEHCGNGYLQRSYTLNFAQVAALRTHLAAYTEAEPHRSFADHEAMRDIFDSGSADDIEAVLAPHILRTRENYKATLIQRQTQRTEGRFDHLKRVLDGLASPRDQR